MCYRDPRMTSNRQQIDLGYTADDLSAMVRFLERSELAKMEKSTQTDFKNEPVRIALNVEDLS